MIRGTKGRGARHPWYYILGHRDTVLNPDDTHDLVCPCYGTVVDLLICAETRKTEVGLISMRKQFSCKRVLPGLYFLLMTATVRASPHPSIKCNERIYLHTVKCAVPLVT